jgi:murein DD-endopeptidase MepM/ murein hydrolase activator NlpD
MKRLWLVALILVPLGVVAQKKPSIDQLKKDLKKIEKKKDQAKDQLAEANKDIRDVRSEISKVDSRLEEADDIVEKTGEQLARAQVRQGELGRSLAEAQAQLAAKQSEVRRRLRAMYMRGQETTLSVLLGLANSGDIASRQFILDRIAKRDRKLFEEYIVAKNRIEADKREQDALVANIASMVQTQKSKQDELEKARADKIALMDSLKDRREDIERIVKEFDDDSQKIEDQLNERMRAAQKSGKSSPPVGDGRFGPPASGGSTSRFGMRFHPILKYNRMHNGIDFGGGYGAPVYATADGVVISTSRLGGYGNAIIIEHGRGLSSVYGHLSRIMVSSGATVRRGQRIGSIGSSGLSTGPHLHFEIRQNGRPVNPSSYL